MTSKKRLHATRRGVIGGMTALGAGAFSNPIGSVKAQTTQKTFVLVHGAYHGGWCWRRVSDLLEEKGHKVFSPTLTGLGERSHLLSKEINLDTHITDVVNVMKWENLGNVVLCGHSYAGLVLSGVAERMQSAISSIVFLDAFVPENGQAMVDLVPQAQGAAYLKRVAEGTPTPPVPAAVFKVNEKDQAWVDSKCTPHPTGTFTQNLTLTGARDRIEKKTFILALGSSRFFKPYHDRLKENPAWKTYEVPCGHDVMVDMPDRLVEILLEVA
jgi:pimeloyl-ACP methyl ester carboxylesterase